MRRSGENNNFNTSHVSINQEKPLRSLCNSLHFNTSHVSINRIADLEELAREKISIHLMFLLIVYHLFVSDINASFNTSHVSINRELHR